MSAFDDLDPFEDFSDSDFNDEITWNKIEGVELSEAKPNIESIEKQFTDKIDTIRQKRTLLVESLHKIETLISEYNEYIYKLCKADFGNDCKLNMSITHIHVVVAISNVEYITNKYIQLQDSELRECLDSPIETVNLILFEKQMNVFAKYIMQVIDSMLLKIRDRTGVSEKLGNVRIQNSIKSVDSTDDLLDETRIPVKTLNEVYESLHKIFRAYGDPS